MKEKTYLALTFFSENNSKLKLKEWKIREDQTVHQGDDLFTFENEGQEKAFTSQCQGTFKAFLWKEGEELFPGKMIAILQTDAKDAELCEKNNHGILLTPQEAKGGMSYAEAASIRLPPEG